MPEPEIIETTALARLETHDLLKAALENGSDITRFERVVALAERVHAIQAKDAFFDAVARFKSKCPPIYKTRKGNFGNWYAPLEEICPKIDPILAAEGLSYRWQQPDVSETKVSIVCVLSHRLGHEEPSGVVAMPIPGAMKNSQGSEVGANAMQRVAIARTYAKRNSLLDVLGLSPEEDRDGQHDAGSDRGGDGADRHGAQAPADGPRVITEQQGKMLWAVARKQLWSQDDVAALLKQHNIVATKDIPMSKFDEILNAIKKEQKTPPASSKDPQSAAGTSEQKPAGEQGSLA